jgi:ATP-dependent protease HslVU (ClpYQ) peptidase subunit
MYANYELPDITAEQIAKKAIEAAAEFDDGTSIPIDSHSITL